MILSTLQWLLMLWGLALVVRSPLACNVQAEVQHAITVARLKSVLAAPPLDLCLFRGVTTGLVAKGLSVVLFHLRRLYLSRAT